MESTVHGLLHILDRTLMYAEDVLSLIQAGAVVDLGQADSGVRYLLFYSPPNKTCKIALVSPNLTSLISIYNDGFRLPQGVAHPTESMKKRAKELLRAYLFSLAKKNGAATEPVVLEIKLRVRRHNRLIYSCSVGDVSDADAKIRERVMELAAPRLRELVTAVALAEVKTKGVQYEIRVVDANRSCISSHYFFGHQDLVQAGFHKQAPT